MAKEEVEVFYELHRKFVKEINKCINTCDKMIEKQTAYSKLNFEKEKHGFEKSLEIINHFKEEFKQQIKKKE